MAWTSPRAGWSWRAATSPARACACVAIRNGADPRLRRNRIHDSKRAASSSTRTAWGRWRTTTSPPTPTPAWRSGPAATPPCAATRSTTTGRGASTSIDGGLGTLEDNDIAANAYSGVEIETGGNPTLRRNQIHDNRHRRRLRHRKRPGDPGGQRHRRQQPTPAWRSRPAATPPCAATRSTTTGTGGVYVIESGLGTLEDNDIAANAYSGVQIETGGNPTLRRNRINRNSQVAIWIHEGGRGVFEQNDLTNNNEGAWRVAEDSALSILRSGNRE